MPVEELQKDVDEFLKRQEADLIAHASAKKATEFKNDGMKPVKEKTKTEVSYAEHAVHYNDADLQKIGWHGRLIRYK